MNGRAQMVVWNDETIHICHNCGIKMHMVYMVDYGISQLCRHCYDVKMTCWVPIFSYIWRHAYVIDIDYAKECMWKWDSEMKSYITLQKL